MAWYLVKHKDNSMLNSGSCSTKPPQQCLGFL